LKSSIIFGICFFNSLSYPASFGFFLAPSAMVVRAASTA